MSRIDANNGLTCETYVVNHKSGSVVAFADSPLNYAKSIHIEHNEHNEHKYDETEPHT